MQPEERRRLDALDRALALHSSPTASKDPSDVLRTAERMAKFLKDGLVEEVAPA